jgi:septal ring factor EnvC (AmiA/AmiB activator)
VVDEMDARLQQQDQHLQELEQENARLQAQLTALHRRQFKARRTKSSRATGTGGRLLTEAPSKKKRGAPVGHPSSAAINRINDASGFFD